MRCVELELTLRLDVGDQYRAELRYRLSDSEVYTEPLQRGAPAQATIDLVGLSMLAAGADAYGRQLGAGLFGGGALWPAVEQARAVAQSNSLPLRWKLALSDDASALHALHWETLRDPRSGALLFAGESVLFSRYLSSASAAPVRLGPKGALTALVAVAGAANLADYGMASLNVDAERRRAVRALGAIPADTLPSADGAQRCTLANLLAGLRAGAGLAYLACHGSLLDGDSWLWLENAQGKAARASGTELAAKVRQLQTPPRLLVLAACQSAASGTGGALAALGPRLAEAGIPAVLAMQGSISVETVERFMPVFFAELERDGQIDRAAAVARSAVSDRPDFWMPALFLRLQSGRLWGDDGGDGGDGGDDGDGGGEPPPHGGVNIGPIRNVSNSEITIAGRDIVKGGRKRSR